MDQAKKYHQTLSEYFKSKPLYLDELYKVKANTRKVMEQPWQQANACLWGDVYITLTLPEFIDAATYSKDTDANQESAAFEHLYRLITDLEMIAHKLPDNL